MQLTVRPLHLLFVGEVTSIDAGRPLDAAAEAALTAAIDRYAVLVLPGQQLDDERQIACVTVRDIASTLDQAA